jgi:hypothetical protein
MDEESRTCVVNALLPPHRGMTWVAWLVAGLLFVAVGNGPIYGLIVPLSDGLLALLAPGLLPSAGRHVDWPGHSRCPFAVRRCRTPRGVGRGLAPSRTYDQSPLEGCLSAVDRRGIPSQTEYRAA